MSVTRVRRRGFRRDTRRGDDVWVFNPELDRRIAPGEQVQVSLRPRVKLFVLRRVVRRSRHHLWLEEV